MAVSRARTSCVIGSWSLLTLSLCTQYGRRRGERDLVIVVYTEVKTRAKKRVSAYRHQHALVVCNIRRRQIGKDRKKLVRTRTHACCALAYKGNGSFSESRTAHTGNIRKSKNRRRRRDDYDYMAENFFIRKHESIAHKLSLLFAAAAVRPAFGSHACIINAPVGDTVL